MRTRPRAMASVLLGPNFGEYCQTPGPGPRPNVRPQLTFKLNLNLPVNLEFTDLTRREIPLSALWRPGPA